MRAEPLPRQARFEGSFRQRRAAALRLVASRAASRLTELDEEAVEALARDGLVAVDEGVVSLPA